MPFTEVDAIRNIEDYSACREATHAFICDPSNKLLDIFYAAALLNKTGQYQVYKGMKQYYDSDSRDIAETAWENSCSFKRFAEKLVDQEAELCQLDDAGLLRRFGGSLYNLFLISGYENISDGQLDTNARHSIAEQLITFTERQEQLRNEAIKRENERYYQ